MEGKEVSFSKIKWITIVLTIFGVYISFRFVLPLIIPFIVAYLLAWIIRPPTEFLYRRLKISRVIGGTISLAVLIAVAGTGIFYLINLLFNQTVIFLKNVPIYLGLLAEKIDAICEGCDKIFGLAYGTVRDIVDEYINHFMVHIKSNVMPGLTGKTLSIAITVIGAIGIILIVFVSTLLILKDLPYFKEKYKDHKFYKEVRKTTDKLADAGIAYLRCQLFIAVAVAIICVIGLVLIKNEYSLLLGIGIAIFDAFPILGSGIIFIPWSIIYLLNGNIYAAAILITTYLLCQVVREVLEPRLIGNHIGIRPIFTLMAMYVGVKLFEIPGFFLGPIGLIMIITIINVINERYEECRVQKDSESV
jgi:sporulation integral membrane protein YtvI